jgi:hypothetical protein
MPFFPIILRRIERLDRQRSWGAALAYVYYEEEPGRRAIVRRGGSGTPTFNDVPGYPKQM